MTWRFLFLFFCAISATIIFAADPESEKFPATKEKEKKEKREKKKEKKIRWNLQK